MDRSPIRMASSSLWKVPESRIVPFPPNCETRTGTIGAVKSVNFDTLPENQLGDIATLKDYANDDDETGSAVVNALIKAHAYWIRQADVDGFRVDAVKHMGPVACSRFCSNIREYAYSLGKRGFFLFGEVAQADDDLYNRYIGQNTSSQDGNNTVFFGLDLFWISAWRKGMGTGDCVMYLRGFKIRKLCLSPRSTAATGFEPR